jgi:hypothetical protein
MGLFLTEAKKQKCVYIVCDLMWFLRSIITHKIRGIKSNCEILSLVTVSLAAVCVFEMFLKIVTAGFYKGFW